MTIYQTRAALAALSGVAPPPVPDFTPVPRKFRSDGWTVERQRGFIAALAELGSVKAACHRTNMTTVGAYYLRRQPGAESFRAAWAAALDFGVQTLTDLAIERAIEGVPVPIYYQGAVVGEKRWFNDRLLMFILKHHLPGKYGTPPLAGGTRHPDTIAQEAAENCPNCKARAAANLEIGVPSYADRKAATAAAIEKLKTLIAETRARLHPESAPAESPGT